MNFVAEQYVRLVLALGLHDSDYVDAYYGPPEWKAEMAQRKMTLAQIGEAVSTLIPELGKAGGDDIEGLRRRYLQRQLESLAARVRILSGTTLSFDNESMALYDAVAPSHPDSYFDGTLTQLEAMLPGTGPLIGRYDAFRKSFIIPAGRLDNVFKAAIAECRKRTLLHMDLPANESFVVDYVTDKPWSGYNWYQGNYRSVIQVNTGLPIYIDRAIDLAAHEGYPGHHVYNSLLEKHLMRDRGWMEISVYALFSPQSLIAEGTANYGIEVVFPGGERLDFERSVLFSEAGLNASRAEEYLKVRSLADDLSYASNEAARRYLDGEIEREAAVRYLMRFAMMSRERAEQRTRFFDRYRSYVINYNLGKDLVKTFVEARTGSGGPVKRWQVFTDLLSTPRLPSGLR